MNSAFPRILAHEGTPLQESHRSVSRNHSTSVLDRIYRIPLPPSSSPFPASPPTIAPSRRDAWTLAAGGLQQLKAELWPNRQTAIEDPVDGKTILDREEHFCGFPDRSHPVLVASSRSVT